MLPAYFCPRCERNTATLGITGSWYYAEMICLDCADDEQLLESYPRAKAYVQAAEAKGNHNVEGIGLTKNEWEQLERLRSDRNERSAS